MYKWHHITTYKIPLKKSGQSSDIRTRCLNQDKSGHLKKIRKIRTSARPEFASGRFKVLIVPETPEVVVSKQIAATRRAILLVPYRKQIWLIHRPRWRHHHGTFHQIRANSRPDDFWSLSKLEVGVSKKIAATHQAIWYPIGNRKPEVDSPTVTSPTWHF